MECFYSCAAQDVQVCVSANLTWVAQFINVNWTVSCTRLEL